MAPMDNRLLRPRASGLFLPSDADARAYVLAVNSADGQPLEKPVVEAIDAFVVGCKADSIWAAIQSSCILIGARTLSGALTPLKGGAPTNVNNNFVSGDYNRKTGLIGNESTKYLDSNRNSNAQDDIHKAVYVAELGGTAGSTLQRAVIGVTVSGNTGQTSIYGRRSDDLFIPRFRSATANTTAGGMVPGFVGASRNNSANFQVITPTLGSASNNSRPSDTPPNDNTFVFAEHLSGTGAQAHTGHRLAFYSIGTSIDLDLFRTRVNTLYAAIGAAIP
jgi:hypothetical protein